MTSDGDLRSPPLAPCLFRVLGRIGFDVVVRFVGAGAYPPTVIQAVHIVDIRT